MITPTPAGRIDASVETPSSLPHTGLPARTNVRRSAIGPSPAARPIASLDY